MTASAEGESARTADEQFSSASFFCMTIVSIVDGTYPSQLRGRDERRTKVMRIGCIDSWRNRCTEQANGDTACAPEVEMARMCHLFDQHLAGHPLY